MDSADIEGGPEGSRLEPLEPAPDVCRALLEHIAAKWQAEAGGRHGPDRYRLEWGAARLRAEAAGCPVTPELVRVDGREDPDVGGASHQEPHPGFVPCDGCSIIDLGSYCAGMGQCAGAMEARARLRRLHG